MAIAHLPPTLVSLYFNLQVNKMEELRQQLEMLNRAMLPAAPPSQPHASLQQGNASRPEDSSVNPFSESGTSSDRIEAPSQHSHQLSGNPPGQTSGMHATAGSGAQHVPTAASVLTATALAEAAGASAAARARHVGIGRQGAGASKAQRQQGQGPIEVMARAQEPEVALQPKRAAGKKLVMQQSSSSSSNPFHDGGRGNASLENPFAGFDT